MFLFPSDLPSGCFCSKRISAFSCSVSVLSEVWFTTFTRRCWLTGTASSSTDSFHRSPSNRFTKLKTVKRFMLQKKYCYSLSKMLSNLQFDSKFCKMAIFLVVFGLWSVKYVSNTTSVFLLWLTKTRECFYQMHLPIKTISLAWVFFFFRFWTESLQNCWKLKPRSARQLNR